MDFKTWILTQLEMFVPGTTTGTRTQDITNTGMGVRSKWLGPIGDKIDRVQPKTADFGKRRKNVST